MYTFVTRISAATRGKLLEVQTALTGITAKWLHREFVFVIAKVEKQDKQEKKEKRRTMRKSRNTRSTRLYRFPSQCLM